MCSVRKVDEAQDFGYRDGWRPPSGEATGAISAQGQGLGPKAGHMRNAISSVES